MIRREVTSEDGTNSWLLIAQMEHARQSAWLAEKCLGRFAEELELPPAAREKVWNELLSAIAKHDDGWADWDRAPALDDQDRPMTFTQLPVEESLAIWDGSVHSAEQTGPLAAWLVASHFSAILIASENHAESAAGLAWLDQTSRRRQAWFAAWHEQQPEHHTAKLAGEALKWIQLFDILSLWPAMSYPQIEEEDYVVPEPFQIPTDWVLVREIAPLAENPNTMRLDPWPFQPAELNLTAQALLVPAATYANPVDLLAAGKAYTASWVLTK